MQYIYHISLIYHCIALCCGQHTSGMPPPSYPIGMMSPPPAQHPYPQATSPALMQQYQYHAPPTGHVPSAPLRAPPPPHCNDYYIPVMNDHHRSFPVNIPNSQHQQPQPSLPPQPQPPPPQCYTGGGVYETRPRAPTTLPGRLFPYLAISVHPASRWVH